MCTYHRGGTSHHGEQHRRRREPVARRPLAMEGDRHGADKLPFVRCEPAAERLLAPFIASVGRRAAIGLAGLDNGTCHSLFHLRRGGPRATVCCWFWSCCCWCWLRWWCWRRRRSTGRRYALKARARRVRDGGWRGGEQQACTTRHNTHRGGSRGQRTPSS